MAKLWFISAYFLPRLLCEEWSRPPAHMCTGIYQECCYWSGFMSILWDCLIEMSCDFAFSVRLIFIESMKLEMLGEDYNEVSRHVIFSSSYVNLSLISEYSALSNWSALSSRWLHRCSRNFSPFLEAQFHCRVQSSPQLVTTLSIFCSDGPILLSHLFSDIFNPSFSLGGGR